MYGGEFVNEDGLFIEVEDLEKLFVKVYYEQYCVVLGYIEVVDEYI